MNSVCGTLCGPLTLRRRSRVALVALLAALVAAATASSAFAWRAPNNFENSNNRLVSAPDAQASREPDVVAAPDGSLVAAWSDQFAMKFGRAFAGQSPEYHDWTVSTIDGTSVPTGTAEDTSKPAVAVQGDKVAIAYLFNFAKAGGGNQHDVMLATGTLTSAAPGIAWDNPAPTRITATDTENARRVSVVFDATGHIHLAWEDDPDSSAADLIRYLEVGSDVGPVVISTPGHNAAWPVLAAETSPLVDRVHVVYTEEGKVVERFSEPGSPRVFGNPTINVGAGSAAQPDLAIVPDAGGGPGTPVVVYHESTACAGGARTEVYAAAPGTGATQLSSCALANGQEQPSIAVRDSDRSVYAVWVRTNPGSPFGELLESRLEPSVGWRWWEPVRVPPYGDASSFMQPMLTVSDSGEQVLARGETVLAQSGQEIVHLSDPQPGQDAANVSATAIPGGGGVRLGWSAFPDQPSSYHALRIVRKPADDFRGPNDPNATVVGTLYTQIKVIDGHYQVIPGGAMPTSFDDTSADPTKSYVYKLFVSHRGPKPTTNFSEMPGYRFGTSVAYGSPPAPAAAPPFPPAPFWELGTGPSPVRALQAIGSDGRVDLSWIDPPTFDSIEVVRKEGSDPASPTDGTVVYTGQGASYADTAVSNGVTYFYAVWVLRGTDLSPPARASAVPNPPGAPSTYVATPTGAYGGVASDYTLGAAFHVTEDKALLRLGRVYKAGSTAGNQVGIWDDATQQLLASVTVGPTEPIVSLRTPVVLQAGHEYVIGVKESAGSPWSSERMLTKLPSYLVIDDTAYIASGSFTFPSSRGGKPGFSNEDWQMTFARPDYPALVDPDPVTNLRAVPGGGRVDLSWTNPTTPFESVKVVRKAGAPPVDPYDGVVVASGTVTTASDTLLANGTTYYYAVWTQRSGLVSVPARTSGTPQLEPGAISYTSQPTGTYSNVADTYVQGAVFHVTQDKTLLQLGRAYAAGSAAGNQIGVWDEATHALLASAALTPASPLATLPTPLSLTAGTRYVIGVKEAVGTPWSGTRPLTNLPSFLVVDDAAFNRNSTLSYPDLRGNVPGQSNEDWTMTFGGDPNQPVTGLRATPGSGRVDLSWTNPQNGFIRVDVVRKANADPASPSDGTLVFGGVASAYADLGVTDGTTYHYAVWVERAGGLSPPARITTTASTPAPDPVQGLQVTPGDGRVDFSWRLAGPTSMAALGDSLTVGRSMDVVDVDRPQSSWATGDDPADGVTSQYERLLAANDAIRGRNFNFAVSGSTASALAAQADRAVAAGVDYVTILSGTNDACAIPPGLPPSAADFRSAVRTALTRLNAGLPNAWIFVASIPDWTRLWTLFGSNPAATTTWSLLTRCPEALGPLSTDADRLLVRQRIQEFNQILGEECSAAQRCRYDLGAVFDTQFAPEDFSSADYFHFSRAGEQRLADATWAVGPWASLATSHVKVVRKAGSDPADPGDGTLVFDGPGGSASDVGVTNGTGYNYAFWVDAGGVLSAPVRATAVPSEYTTYTTPLGDYGGAADTYNLGTVFHVASDKSLVKLGRVYKPGSTASNQIGIWREDTQQLVYSTTVSPSSPSVALATPILLQAGVRYVLGIKEELGSPWSTGRAATNLPGFLSIDDAAFNRNSTFGYPDLRQGSANVVADDWTMTFGRPDSAPLTLVQPVNALQAVPGDTRVDLSWTNPTSAFDRVIVVRQAGTPPNTPSDGTVVYSGPGTAFADTGLVNGTLYHYAVWVGRSGDLSVAERLSVTPTGLVPDPVTQLRSTPGATKIALSWTNPTSPFDRVEVVRKAGGVPANPTDGTVVYTGVGTSVADTGLVNGTLYGYAVWVERGAQLSGAARLSATPGEAPLNPVTAVATAALDGQVALSWSNPVSFDSIKIVRKAGSAPADPTDGTPVYDGTGTSLTDSSLVNGTVYYYALWAARGTSLSNPVVVSETPRISQVSGLVAVAGDRRVDLSWTNPSTAFDTIQVVRKAGGAPTSPTDGTLVFDGNSTAAADAGLVNGTLYYYAVWIIRGGQYASPSVVSAIPFDPAGLVDYTASPSGGYGSTGPGYNLGAVFHVTADKALLRLGRVFASGSTSGNRIGIWDEATQVLLASVSVTPSAPLATLDRPLVLRAGKRYVLGVVEATGTPWSGRRTLTGLPSFLVIDDAAFNRSSTLSYPDLRNDAPGQSNEDWTMSFGPISSVPAAPDPVTSLTATAGDSRVDLAWTNPTTAFEQVIVVRKAGSAAPTDPSDGTRVYSGTGTSVADTGLVDRTLYQYAVWTQAGGQLSAAAQASATPREAAPNPVANLQATPRDRQIDLTWTNPSGSFDRVIVVRKAGAAPASPTDGTVVFSGVASAASDTGLTNGTVYQYGVWVDFGGLDSAPARVTATPAAASLDPVTNLQTSPDDFRVTLTWTNPTTPFDQILVVRKAGGAPGSPTDGTLVYSGAGSSVVDTGLANGTTYSYAVWVQRSGQLATPVRTTAVPAPPTLTSVTDLTATPTSFRVDLTWTNPSFRFDQVTVVRKVGATPTSPTDGTLVYQGTGTSVGDTGLVNGTTYRYAVWVTRDGALSPAATAVATPVDATSALTYASQPSNYTGVATTYNLGAVFHVTADKVVLKLGRAYKAGSTGGNTVAIWDDATRQLLVSASVTPAAPEATLATPLTLTAGKRYVISSTTAAGSPWSSGRTLSGLPSFLVIDDAAFNRNSALSFPDLRNSTPGQSNDDWTITFSSAGAAPPPDPVAAAQAVAGDGRIDLSWTNPTTAFDFVEVVRKQGAAPAAPTDGTVVYSGTGSAFADTGLANGATYDYAIWVSRLGALSAPVRASGVPLPPAPAAVTGFRATAGDGAADLAWTNPSGSFDRIRVVRKADSAPRDPSDGTTVFSGTAASYSDTGLANGTTYYYAAWVEYVGQLSSAARTSATPSATTAYTASPTGDYSSTLPYNIGVVFHVTQSKAVLKLGRVYEAGSTAGNTIGIWDEATSSLLGSVDVAPAAPAAPLAQPVVLQAGKRYVLSVGEAPGSPWSSVRQLSGLPSFMVLDDTAFNRNSTFTYPDLRNDQTPPIAVADDWSITFGPPTSGALVVPDPVSGLVATPGDGRADLAWSNPATAFDRVTVVRKQGAPPANPADGTVVYSGTGSAASDTGLANGTLVYYGVWTDLAGELSTPARATATPTGAVPDPVSALQTTPGESSVGLAWTNPTSPFDSVVVVRKAGGAPANPSDGTVVFSGVGTSVTDSGLTDGTLYDYAVWTVRGGAFSTAVRTSAIAGLPAPDAVTSLQATAGDGSVALSWQSPSPLDTVQVVRKAGAPPADPTDGTEVFDGVGGSAIDTGLANGTTYHYAAWVVRGGQRSTATRTSATPTSAPPAPISSFRAVAGDGTVSLAWTNPTGAFDSVKIVRKANGTPTDPADGTVVFDGTGTSVSDAGLANATDYHYVAWVLRGGSLSSAVEVVGVPNDPATLVPYTTQPVGDHANTATGYNLGVVFHVTQDRALTALGRGYSAGSTGANDIGVYDDATGTLLASATVTPTAPLASLPSALVLRAGKKYVLGVRVAAGSPWSGARPLTGLPGFLVVDDSAYNRDSAFSYPNLRDNQSAPVRVADDWTLTFAPVGALPAPPDPATAVAATPGDARVDLTWTNPSTTFDAIKVVRKAGTAPATPADGTVIYSGTGTSVSDTGLVNGTLYHYAVWVVRSGQLSTPARVSATPLQPPPPAVQDLRLDPGDTQVVLTWTNPTVAFDRIDVVRKAGAAPLDATDGTLVFSGVGTRAVDNGLVNGTLYHYAVWVERAGQLSSAVRATATPVEPPLDPVTNLVATPGDLRVDLAWTNPTTPFDTIEVVRKIGSAPTGPADGTLVANGIATSFADTGLANGTAYYYAVWAQRAARLSTLATVSATPVAPPLATVGSFAATPGDGSVSLSWVAPSFRFDRILVVRKAGSAPSDPADGTQIYSGSGASVRDDAVSNGTTYFYAAWVERDGARSAAARASATPIDTASYLDYAATPRGAYGNVTAYTAGAVFHVTEDKVLVALGRTYKAGSTAGNQIGIWDDATKTLLGSVSVTPAGAKAALATPILLHAGTRYVIGVVEAAGTPWSGTRTLTGLPGFLVIDDGAFNRNGTLSYPDVRNATPGQSNEDWTMTFAAAGTVAAPDPVTGLAASWNDSRVALTWTNPTTPLDLVEVVRKAGSAPASPSDGTVVYTGTGAAFTDTGLANGTAYSYAVWVLHGGKLSTAARVTSTPNVPVDPVTGLTATPGDLSVSLAWTNPTTRFDRVLVVRKAGSAPADTTDGSLVYSGTGSSLSDPSLANGTTYHYGVWVERDGLLSFTAARASATPVAPTLVTVSGLQAVPGNGRVDLSWTNPTIRFDRVVVVSKAGGAPADPTDGTTVYSGTGVTAAQTGLANGTAYGFAVWVEREGELSPAARAQATPRDAATELAYTATPTGGYANTILYNAGAVFHLTDDKLLTKVGRVYKAGSTGGNDIGIWDEATQTLLASAAVTPGSPTASLPQPVVLKAGKRYVIGIRESSGSPWSGSRTLTGLPGFLVVDDSAFNRNSTLSYPDLRNNTPGQSNDDWTMTFAAVGTPLAPDPATAASATAGDGKVTVAWTNPTTAFDLVQVVRKGGSAPLDPTDGTLVYSGTGSSLVDAGVANGTTYHYAVWTFRAGVPGTPARASATPLPAGVTGLQATPGDLRVDLAWTNPAAPFDSVTVVRKAAGDPVDPTDGTVVYSGTGASASDTGLANGTDYHYAVWAIRGGLASPAARVTATPTPPALVGVTGFQATAGNAQVDLSWTNPAIRFDGVRVVRKAGSAPADETDGAVVYSGTGSSTSDTGLTNGTTYFYAAFVLRDGAYSAPALASALPVDTASAITYAATPAGSYGNTLAYNAGAVFHLTDDKALTKLGRAYKAGSTAANRIGIWDDATRTLLLSVSVSPASPVATLPSPLVLQAGKRYVIGVSEAAGSPWSGARALTGLPAFLVVDDAAFNRDSTLTFPDLRNNTPGQANEDWTMTFAAAGAVTADPVMAFQATPGYGRVDVAWTNPTTPFDLVEVVRKTGSAPADSGDGTVVYSGSGTSFADTSVTNGTAYYYAAWVLRGGAFSTPARASATPGPDPVTGLQAAAGDTKVTLSWQNPAALDSIRVVRKAAAAPADPTDGTLVYSGTGTGVVDAGVVNGTTYHYAVWVTRGSDLSVPARATATPVVGAPGPVTGLQATPGDLRVDLSWTNPAPPFDSVQVVRKAGADPADAGDGTVVFSGTGTSAADTGLVNGTTYHYAVFALRGGLPSAPARANATPVAPALTSVTGLQAVAGDGRVDLSWTNPTIRFDAISVVRKAGSPPADRTDGTVVYSGTGSSTSDTGITNGTTYHYAVFVVRDGVYSAPARASALPVDAGSEVTYTAAPQGSYGSTLAFNAGAVFHVTTDQALTRLGRVYKAGSTAGNQIGVWDEATQTLLASVSVSPATPLADLPSPLVLQAGKRYVVGVSEAAGSPWSAARALTGLPSFLVVDDAAFNRNATLSYPDLRNNTPGQSNEDWTMTFAPVAAAPAPDPVTGVSATAGNGRVDLSWTNPTTPFDLVEVVRKAGAQPADPGDGTLVYSGTAAGAADTGLANGTTYHYAIWTLRSGVLSGVVRATATPAVTPDPVSALDASVGDGRVDLTWTNPTTLFDTVQVVRKAGSPPADPSDGTLVYSGVASAASDTTALNGTTYDYAVWTVLSGIRSTAARVSATPAAAPAPPATQDPVTSLEATAGDTRIDLSWLDPNPFERIEVVRKAGSPPADPTDGTQIYEGTGTSVADTGLVNGTTYHYGVWAASGSIFSVPARVSGTPTAAPDPVSALAATPGSGEVVLSWTNPTSAFDEIRVVRKADVDPDGPTDGTVVYSGTGTGVTDGGLAADTVYHYAVWTVAGGVFSADAVRATATPQP